MSPKGARPVATDPTRGTPTRRGLLAGGAALFLAGCGGGGFDSDSSDPSGSDDRSDPSARAKSDGAGGEPVELRMLVNITPNLTKSFWRDLVAPFEAANGVAVRIDAPSGGGVRETLPQLLAADDVPDVVETLMVDERLAGQMSPLTDQGWVPATPLADAAALDGELYTVGVGMQAQSLVYYHRASFADAGIDTRPTDFDQLTDAMAALKRAGYLPLQTAGDYVTGLQMQQLIWPSLLAAEPDLYARVAAGEVVLSEVFEPYFERYHGWLQAGYLDPNALGLTDADAQTAFFAGDAGMYIMGSWLVSSVVSEADPDEFGVFSSPVAPGQDYPGPLGATMAMPYMVTDASRHREEAIELVRWLVTDSDAITTQLRQDGNFRPGHEWCDTELCGGVQQIIDDAPTTIVQGEGYGDQTLPPGFNAEFYEAVQELYVGTTPKEAVARLDAWMEANG